MSRLQIEPPDGRTHFEPGTEIEARITWELDEPCEALELRLVWNTAGKGTTDLAVVDTVRFENPPPQGSEPVALRLPHSPYSFSGRLVSLVWALELVALPDGDSTRQEIVVAPAGREILLGSTAEST
jgi:hypothetical protein